MGLLEELLVNVVAVALPQGNTLAGVKPDLERVDALISHGVAVAIGHAGSPLVQAIYQSARPLIDGAIVEAYRRESKSNATQTTQAGRKVSAGRTQVNQRVRKGRKALPAPKGSSAERQKKREFTSKGIEILDAEFVDVPEGR